jgi:hypothetical protein
VVGRYKAAQVVVDMESQSRATRVSHRLLK